MSEWILSTDNLSRSFGGLAAVDQVTFQVKKHEVFGIVGPNGAGKSTLFNLIAGVLPPSQGRIEAFGRRIDRLPAQKRSWLGIGRTFQASQMFPTHTIGESLLSAGSAKHRGVSGWLRPVDLEADHEEMLDFLLFVGLEGMQDLLPSELTNLQQQKLAIGMALITDPQLLLLDEPSGGLIEAEVLELLAFIRSIRDRGVTIVVIDHKMRLMMELSDRIMVMSAGQMIALDVPKNIANDINVQNAYLGRPVAPDKAGSEGSK